MCKKDVTGKKWPHSFVVRCVFFTTSFPAVNGFNIFKVLLKSPLPGGTFLLVQRKRCGQVWSLETKLVYTFRPNRIKIRQNLFAPNRNMCHCRRLFINLSIYYQPKIEHGCWDCSECNVIKLAGETQPSASKAKASAHWTAWILACAGSLASFIWSSQGKQASAPFPSARRALHRDKRLPGLGSRSPSIQSGMFHISALSVPANLQIHSESGLNASGAGSAGMGSVRESSAFGASESLCAYCARWLITLRPLSCYQVISRVKYYCVGLGAQFWDDIS